MNREFDQQSSNKKRMANAEMGGEMFKLFFKAVRVMYLLSFYFMETCPEDRFPTV